MPKASQVFRDDDRQAVKDAIARAESSTNGEIVPVVASQSGRYDRGEDIFGVILGLVAMGVVWAACQQAVPKGGDWASGYTVRVGFAWLALTFVVAFVAGVVLATKLPALALPFVSKAERADSVRQRAGAAFFELGVRGTADSTGIMIYVSLLERIVCVIGDEPISEKLDEGQWEEIKALVIEGLEAGKPTEGLCAGIARCGELLAEHFPIAPDDEDELSNELHVID